MSKGCGRFLAVALLFGFLLCGPAARSGCVSDYRPTGRYRQDLIADLQKAIELETATHDYDQEKRERFLEEKLFPTLTLVVSRLACDADEEMATIFFKVIVAYQNSTDETFPDDVGDFFLNNPDLFERTLFKFSKSDQKWIYKELEFGFLNETYNKPANDPAVIAARERLKTLKVRVGT